jgi:hypothetical protein
MGDRPMNLTLSILSTTSVIASSIAAIMATRAHGRIDHLDVSLDGRMSQLLQSTHAAGVVEGVITNGGTAGMVAAIAEQHAIIEKDPATS